MFIDKEDGQVYDDSPWWDYGKIQEEEEEE